MARNKLAGTKVGNSKSAKFYQDNPDAKKKKDKYNAKYGASLSRKLYRAFLNAMNKKKGKKDACYHKVKARYKVWPSAYASGALVKCRKKGAKNWGTGGKKKKKK